jgi:hypothetical protein
MNDPPPRMLIRRGERNIFLAERNRSLPNRGTIAAIRTALSRRLQVPRESPLRLFETQIWRFRQVVCRVKV